MDKSIQKILDIWHKRFKDEELHYSEFESSDIEYFVSCLLYNHFNFSNALSTMKTIDLSYDFISSCGDEYDEIQSMVKNIVLESEIQKLEFLEQFLDESQKKYTKDELYLLNRMAYHVAGVRQRYESDIKATKVEFSKPAKKPRNPLESI